MTPKVIRRAMLYYAKLQRACWRPAATRLWLADLVGTNSLLYCGGNDATEMAIVASALVKTIAKPFEFLDRKIEVGVSIGIALAPHHGSRTEELLSAADLALYKAKAAGRGRYEVFSPSFREVAVARRHFESELRRAHEEGEFELYYQPQVSTATGRVTGAEALIRWNHPERGVLSPASFIDVLSQKPSAASVGEWILRTACWQASEWRHHLPDFRIGVNLFEAQVRSGRLLTVVKNALAESGLPPSGLELELVENILLHDDVNTLQLLRSLRSLGVDLAFDDYGTGFASLSLLKRFPVTRLKIDRSFVRDVDTDPEDAAIVRAVIYLGQSFGLEVIAEGVESDAQRSFLLNNRCEECQGYLFGKPVPAAQFYEKFIVAARIEIPTIITQSISPAALSDVAISDVPSRGAVL